MPNFLAYSYTPESSPPLHEPQPVLSLPHETMFWTESIVCGRAAVSSPFAFAAFFETMFQRSASADDEPIAQHEPQ